MKNFTYKLSLVVLMIAVVFAVVKGQMRTNPTVQNSKASVSQEFTNKVYSAVMDKLGIVDDDQEDASVEEVAAKAPSSDKISIGTLVIIAIIVIIFVKKKK